MYSSSKPVARRCGLFSGNGTFCSAESMFQDNSFKWKFIVCSCDYACIKFEAGLSMLCVVEHAAKFVGGTGVARFRKPLV